MQDLKRSLGNVSEAIIAAHYMQAGYVVLFPFGGSERYDMVIDKGDGKFLRVQCKSAKISMGAVRFKTRSVDRSGLNSRSYHGDVELVTAYCRDNGLIYEMPIDECPRDEAVLRLQRAKNNQASKIRMAADYERAMIQPR